MLKEETAAILADAERIAQIRQEIKTISDDELLPLLPESLFSVTLSYKQFCLVLRGLMKGERIAETIAEQYEWSPALRKFASDDKTFIASVIETLEALPASAVRVEEGI